MSTNVYNPQYIHIQIISRRFISINSRRTKSTFNYRLDSFTSQSDLLGILIQVLYQQVDRRTLVVEFKSI